MIFAEISARMPVLPPHFVIHLVDQLTEEESAFAAARTWLESKLDVSFQDLVRREHALQSTKQVSIANDALEMSGANILDIWQPPHKSN